MATSAEDAAVPAGEAAGIPASEAAEAPSQNTESKDESTSGDGKAMLGMFATDEKAQQPPVDLDLDDLFHTYYFGDFPVPNDVVSGAVVPGEAAVQNATPQTAAAAPVAQPTPVAVQPPVTSVAQDLNNTQLAAVSQQTVAAIVQPPAAAPQQAVPVAASQPQMQVSQQSTVATVAPLAAQHLATAGTKRKAEEAVAVTSQPGIPTDSKELTEEQKVERRERNREHAKRSRLRKKFLLKSLQDQIYGLQGEIETLKGIIRKELPDKAEALLTNVEGDKDGKFTPLPLPSGFGPVKTLIEPDFRLMSSLNNSQQTFAISDPSLPDNPIVYCSQGFLDLTGYTLDQVLGRNCRFLQGPGTEQGAVDVIRKGIREGVDTSVCLLNYKADGTPFWNQFFVAALRDAHGNVVNYVGVQCEVSKAVVESQLSQNNKDS